MPAAKQPEKLINACPESPDRWKGKPGRQNQDLQRARSDRKAALPTDRSPSDVL